MMEKRSWGEMKWACRNGGGGVIEVPGGGEDGTHDVLIASRLGWTTNND